MTRKTSRSASLGDLIAAAFDEAEAYGADPAEVCHLATLAVTDLLRRDPRVRIEAWPAVGRSTRGSWPEAAQALAATR